MITVRGRAQPLSAVRGHQPQSYGTKRKSTASIPWPICTRCGLVYLRNEATAKAVKKGCPRDED